MERKTKILLLFLLLALTPFIKGCGESFGFPFPAFGNILTNSEIETFKNLLGSFRSPESILFLVVNILFACLLSRAVSRNRNAAWSSSFLRSLAIHLAVVWIMVFLIVVDIKGPSLVRKALNFYGTCFGRYFFDVPSEIAGDFDTVMAGRTAPPATFFKISLGYLDLSSMDLTSRAWFIAVTSMWAVAIYVLRKWRRKR